MTDALAAVTSRIRTLDRQLSPGQFSTTRARGGAAGRVLGVEVATPARSAASVQFAQVWEAARGTGGTDPARWVPPTADVHDHDHAQDVSTALVDGVPADLVAYGNGQIPAAALTPIGVGNHRLWAPAAAAFADLQAAAAADGITIGVTDSYRDYDTQVRLAQEKGLYSQGGLAATPGTSKHGWGKAVDLSLDPAAQAWMRRNAGQFGFVENVPREPWHWEYLTPAER